MAVQPRSAEDPVSGLGLPGLHSSAVGSWGAPGERTEITVRSGRLRPARLVLGIPEHLYRWGPL